MAHLLAALLLSLFIVHPGYSQEPTLVPFEGDFPVEWVPMSNTGNDRGLENAPYLIALPDQDQLAGMLLARGLEAEVMGYYELALKIWEDARLNLETPSVAIGTEYIRLATEQMMDAYYPTAVEMYDWGLSAESITPWNRLALRDELDRLEPAIPQGDRMRWNQLYEANDAKLLGNIRLFWEMRNPLPGRPGNLRLIEHWERIAYAREHFTREVLPPYGTDERGTYYVRYGEIDRRYQGQFSVEREDIRRMMNRYKYTDPAKLLVVINEIKAAETNPDFVSDPEYDIWIYDGPDKAMEYNLVLMFGEDGDGGFGRIHTLEEYMPDYHVRGIFGEELQWLYYEQVSDFDPFLRHMFDEMDHKKRSGGLFSNPIDFKFYNEAFTEDVMETAPLEIPTEERKLPGIPLNVTQYRMLDRQSQPIFLSFVESYPSSAFLFNVTGGYSDEEERDPLEILIENEPLGFYNLVHGLRLGDESGRQLGHSRFTPDIEIDLMDQIPSTSVFPIPYVSPNVIQTFYTELENHNPDSEPLTDTRFPDYIRGLGRITIPQPEPLVDTGELLMSDLILGFQRETNPSPDVYLPFVVSNNRQIPAGENLAIHFEVYNLRQNPDGIASFEVEYIISSVRQVLLWERVRERDDSSITLSFQIDNNRFAESVEIQTGELSPGEFELLWRARDLNSGQLAERTIRFTVTEQTVDSTGIP